MTTKPVDPLELKRLAAGNAALLVVTLAAKARLAAVAYVNAAPADSARAKRSKAYHYRRLDHARDAAADALRAYLDDLASFSSRKQETAK